MDLNTQAQSPCDGITISGTQFGATIVVASTAQALFIETTSPNGIVLGQDSLTNSHYFQTGGNFNTVVTCIHTMNTMCCETYVWNGTVWAKIGVTSIENEQIINFSSLYPNPVKDVAVLEFNSSKNTNISIAIYDIFGRQLSTSSIRISIGNNKINLETSKLANGYYLVNASCDEGEFKKTIQFTKQ